MDLLLLNLRPKAKNTVIQIFHLPVGIFLEGCAFDATVFCGIVFGGVGLTRDSLDGNFSGNCVVPFLEVVPSDFLFIGGFSTTSGEVERSRDNYNNKD